MMLHLFALSGSVARTFPALEEETVARAQARKIGNPRDHRCVCVYTYFECEMHGLAICNNAITLRLQECFYARNLPKMLTGRVTLKAVHNLLRRGRRKGNPFSSR